MAIPRSEILKNLYAKAEQGIPIIGGRNGYLCQVRGSG